nr:MAG TPA: hypothetical protein [Caudoviricetes sp.]
MSIKIQSDLNTKCQNCPYFKAGMRTDETEYNKENTPMTTTSFIVHVGCEHKLICDAIEEHLKVLYGRGELNETYKEVGLPKMVCGKCGTPFYYDTGKHEATCPKCGKTYQYL